MSTIVDKSSIGLGGRQFHIGVAPGEVSTVVAACPATRSGSRSSPNTSTTRRRRAQARAPHDGRHVSAAARSRSRRPGMGCPSTAIAVEELARVGVTSFIRVGQHRRAAAGHRARRPDRQPGLVPQRRHDRCLRPEGLPGRARPGDHARAGARRSRSSAPTHDLAVHAGLNVTDDAFYAESPGVDRADVRTGPAQRRDGVVGDVRRRAPARPACRR